MLPQLQISTDLISESWVRSLGKVGGDFIESAPLPDGWRIVLGDISGHGIEAASAARAVRARIAEDLHGTVDANVLRAWNRDLHAALAGRFVCLTLLEFAAGAGRLTIANAGNPAVLVRRGDGRVDSYPGTGPILGLLCDREWLPPQFVQTSLAAGDRVVCFTDGLTEQSNARREMFGLERVKQLLSQFYPSPVRMLRRGVRAFARSVGRQDDVTVLAIQACARAA
jgi:serine phosphatase RsbU (regulator of sigma subunit)